MDAIELKSNLHAVIDRINSEQLLQALYDFLITKENQKAGQLLESLDEDQRIRLFKSYEESEEDVNLTELSKVIKRK